MEVQSIKWFFFFFPQVVFSPYENSCLGTTGAPDIGPDRFTVLTLSCQSLDTPWVGIVISRLNFRRTPFSLNRPAALVHEYLPVNQFGRIIHTHGWHQKSGTVFSTLTEIFL